MLPKICLRIIKMMYLRVFKPYMTSTGIGLNNIEDAISFSTYHDGIHLGIVISQMKIV